MGGSENRGTPKWMVCDFMMENPIKMDDFRVPLFLETPKRDPPNHSFMMFLCMFRTHFGCVRGGLWRVLCVGSVVGCQFRFLVCWFFVAVITY